MDSQEAASDLQLIRTLMERSALYRRALGPILLYVGALGTLGAVGGIVLGLETMLAFGLYWSGIAAIAIIGAFLMARRQAFQAREPFWSPPTRRVTQAILPGFVAAAGSGLGLILSRADDSVSLFVVLCLLFYGCAVHAAGFFTPRGLRGLGWTYIVGVLLMILVAQVAKPDWGPASNHALMGIFFGLVQLGYGIGLRITEKKNNAS